LAIERRQQPPAELLFDRVMPITACRLANLYGQRLRIAQQQMLGVPASIEFLLQDLRLEPVAEARGLHHRRTGRRIAAHEQRDSQHAFVADTRYFRRFAGFHDVQHRHDGGRGKMRVQQLLARTIEGFTEPHRKPLQVRRQLPELRSG